MIDWQTHIRRNQRYEAMVKRVCAPLTETLGISHFGYAKIYADGRLNWVNSDSRHDELFFEERMYMHAPYMCNPDLIAEGVHHVDRHRLPKELQKVQEFWEGRVDVDDCVFFANNRGSFMELYSFACQGKNDSLADIPLLTTFIEHFDAECTNMKKRMADHPIDCISLKGDAFYKKPEIAGRPNPSKRQQFLLDLGLDKRFPGLHDLTAREQQVLEAVALRLPQKLIAERLMLSQRTVEFYILNIRGKLGIDDREELVQAGKLLRTYNGRSSLH